MKADTLDGTGGHMCGIFATLHTDGATATSAEVHVGARALRHRGPDGQGSHLNGPAGLGFRRLAIIDPANGHQPFVSDDGRTALVGNGELYEAAELRADLRRRGARFRTGSDIEVALHLYLTEGIAAVAQLRGMFAIAIWDARRGELLVLRDRFGIKPAYWHDDGRVVRVASEPRALVSAAMQPPQLDTAALRQVLTFGYLPGDASGLRGVRSLPPGHLLRVNLDGTVVVEPVVETSFDPDAFASRPTLVAQTREALEGSVAHHLVSDVPVGAFLSSGIDSAALVALARRHGELDTFSVGVEGTIDESELAASTATALGVRHHRRMLGPGDIFGSLPEVVGHLGPIADPSAVALYHVAGLAREHVTVALSGEGADELFGGYRTYRQPRVTRAIQALPDGLRRRLHRSVTGWDPDRRGRAYLQRATGGVEHWYRGNVTTTSDPLRDRLLSGGSWRGPSPRDALAASWARSRHLDEVTRMQTVDLDTWLPGDILAKADLMSMAHGLEVRVPYLDEHVWSVARRIPAHLRLRGGTTKRVLRDAVADLLPSEVVNRPKLGFPVPVGGWLRGTWGAGLADRVLLSPVGASLVPSVVHEVTAEHRDGSRDHGRLLWALLVLATWSEQIEAGQLDRTVCLASS